MGPFVWLMDGPLMKEGWRSASMDCGGQCVMITGITMMPELCADNWVTASAQVDKVELGIRLIIEYPDLYSMCWKFSCTCAAFDTHV